MGQQRRHAGHALCYAVLARAGDLDLPMLVAVVVVLVPQQNGVAQTRFRVLVVEVLFAVRIDDHVEICKKTGADGVHLGKNDMSPAEARKILGNQFIIGGTCNTYEDILTIKDHVGVLHRCLLIRTTMDV